MTSAARRPLVVGNWKMHTTVPEALELVRSLLEELPEQTATEVVLLPPYISIWPVHQALEASGRAGVGAQDCYWEPKGAFTGEVSAAMLQPPCRLVLVGHSERRHVFGESDEVVRLKLEAVLRAGLSPLLAVGETLEERERGETEAVVKGQCRFALQGLDATALRCCALAYEPVWAIGSGRTATPGDVEQVASWIRELVDGVCRGAAQALPVLYGGSVTAASAPELLAPADIDGALVGGASLDAKEFAQIVRAAEPAS
ncbi:MAG: triose-phosphate isomerase [Candidatus Dormibacteria bacterium]